MSWWRRLLGKPREYHVHGTPIELAPGGQTIAGTVVGGPLSIRGAPAAGCLGGPLVFEIPELALRIADGREVTLERTERALIDGVDRLAAPAPPPVTITTLSPSMPPPGAIVFTPKLLDGRIELINIVPAGADRYRVPAPYRLIIRITASTAA